VKNRDDPERSLVWCIGDEVLIARDMESQRSSGQVRTSVPDVWCSGEQGESRMDVGENPVGGIDVVFRDVFTS
jgi:hypothetical protein